MTIIIHGGLALSAIICHPGCTSGYDAPGFWAPTLQEVQQRCASQDWAVGDVANGALLAARVATRAESKLQEPKALRMAAAVALQVPHVPTHDRLR